MDQFSDPILKLKYRKCKFKVKQWEKEFREKSGLDPSKDDIKEAPIQIREAYKWYWQLKIHAIGQDSLKDATLVDIHPLDVDSSSKLHCTNQVDISDTCLDRSPSRASPVHFDESTAKHAEDVHCLQNLSRNYGASLESVSPDSASDVLQSSNELSEGKCSFSNTNHITMPPKLNALLSSQRKVKTDDPAFDDKTESCEVLASKEENKVWGHHLNHSSSENIKSTKINLSRSSSFQLAEKLFHGSRFKKRNPRKSLSFCNTKTKTPDSNQSTENLSQISDYSYSLDSQDDGFPVSALEESVADTKNPTPDFIVVRKSVTPSVQPVSAVQKLLMDNSFDIKSKSERKIDKGWIERVSAVNGFHPNSSNPETDLAHLKYSESGSVDIAQFSDDDIIYDSDSDSKDIDLKSRLSLLPSINKEVMMSRVSDDHIENKIIKEPKVELHPMKRKFDAVETALNVLSENMEQLDPHTVKRQRKSSESEWNKDKKQKIKDKNELTSEHESESQSKSRGQKLTKIEVLEKRVASGTANDNFIRINIKKKVFVRGKKTMNFQKYKKQQWKRRKKETANEANAAYASRMDPSDGAAGGGLMKCFKCGDIGHFARTCLKPQGDNLLPNDEIDEDESPFPSLAEVEKMARECGKSMEPKASLLLSKTTSDLASGNAPEINGEHLDSNDECNGDEVDPFVQPILAPEICLEPVQALYPLNKDGSVIETPQEVYDSLHLFGHQEFRPGQEEAVMRILSGLSTLVTLSTGSGKSLCYQIPAYIYANHRKCITLVVSPLVSLMDDQVTGLPSFIKAAALHTGQTDKQKEKVMELIRSGSLQFLLVSPEAVVAGERKTGFGRILRELPNIAFACIDEVHCISQWSHNFRPSYLTLCKVLREKLQVKTILGLTATATQSTVKSIIELLCIPDGVGGVIKDIPLPHNLLLTVSRDTHRDQALVKLLSLEPFQSFESVIIYCTRREECDRLATLLRTCLKDSKMSSKPMERISSTAEAYHAGLSSARRKQVQNAFMAGKLRVVVATVAFGMGINKSNIRAVIHFNMPKTFESYVQEVGRAGRDGKAAHCHLFLNDEGKDLRELRRHIFADSLDRHTIRKLLHRIFVPCKCGGTKSKIAEKGEDDNELTFLSPKENNYVTPELDLSSCTNQGSSCVGHEVAFSIEKTVQALDLPEENILTLLSYLELHDQHFIKVLPNAYTLCKVQSYRGTKHIRHVAKTCPPLAMAVAMDLMNDKEHEKTNTLEFPVVDIANSINWDSGTVKRELCNLEWTTVGGQTRRSGLKVELSDLGFRVKAPGNLTPEQMDAALDFLHHRVEEKERSSLHQLECIFNTLNRVSFCDIHSMMNSSNSELCSEGLKQAVRSYFQENHPPAEDFAPDGNLTNSEQIASDIRQLVNMYRDCSFTGRAVARIFHGVGSPNFPPQVWGRCRFWRSHLDSDFKLLCQLATHVLLEMR